MKLLGIGVYYIMMRYITCTHHDTLLACSNLADYGEQDMQWEWNYLEPCSDYGLGGCKTTLNTPDQDSNLNIPVIGSLVYCESSVLGPVPTELQVFDANKDGRLQLSEMAKLLPVKENFLCRQIFKVSEVTWRTRLSLYRCRNAVFGRFVVFRRLALTSALTLTLIHYTHSSE
uniref:(California timema) hypothetical protein n=1 Tax=Timema californicum TaxID=61474 RepID=A0A7R9J7M6_TIMCA|nr:unnamed protein product [Timema californicum]